MKIAILYICTGKYSIFWNTFYASSQQYFYPEIEKSYFVFTDDEKLIKGFKDKPNIHPYFQRCAGWPFDTLLRFNSFATIQDLLPCYDYCYFWNANTVFLKRIDENVIPFPTKEKELVLWRHTLSYDCDRPEQFNAEKNPESEAYVVPGTECHSYGGGFHGGTATGFIKMSITLRDRIARDMEKGLIATQHDQSHIVKYGIDVSCVEVPRNVIVSEEYMEGRNPYVIFCNKQHYGGMHNLREMSQTFKIKVWLYEVCRKFLGIVGLKKIVKKIIHYCPVINANGYEIHSHKF